MAQTLESSAPELQPTEPASASRTATPRVLVTGASRGIGQAIALECLRRGIGVAVTYHQSPSGADEVLAAASELDVHASAHRYALGSLDDARDLARTLASEGPVDALILNAGVWRGGRMGTLSDADWWSVVELNLRSAYQLSCEMLPLLSQSEAPSITIISSVVGLIGYPGDTAYASAKAGLIGLARSMAKELSRSGVRVNVLAPGLVETDMTGGLPEGGRDRIVEDILLRRMGRPEEIAACAAFLAFDATYVTGSVLTADGGWSL